MDKRPEASEARAKTNASLGAERCAEDASDWAALVALRVLDDAIDRDRIAADERLFRFRANADTVLALERLVSPTRDKALALERRLADENTQAERAMADEALDRQRRRRDQQADAQGSEANTERREQLARRQETDGTLDAERIVADTVERDTAEALDSAAKESDRRRDLLAMVSHDLRSPLAVITLSAGFLLEDPSPSDTREIAEDIERAAARMKRLVYDLLDVVRAEQGTLSVVKREHDVSALLREVSRTYRPIFAGRSLEFEVDEPSAPLMAVIDHDRVVQVLSNLLGNAMKFTPSGGKVELGVCSRVDAVEFEVRDSGAGISPAALPHVFECFWQSNRSARRGLGLGLYICQQIVEAHGGHIQATSVPGAGATFRFELPLGSPAVTIDAP